MSSAKGYLHAPPKKETETRLRRDSKFQKNFVRIGQRPIKELSGVLIPATRLLYAATATFE